MKLKSIMNFTEDKKSYHKYLILGWLHFFIWAGLIIVVLFVFALKGVYLAIAVFLLTILSPTFGDIFIGYIKYVDWIRKRKKSNDIES